jgi:mannose-6-phosphate isomerase-like protein (cupin superfamily)
MKVKVTMNVFELNHQPLAAAPGFESLAGELSALTPIDSPESFNRYCHRACHEWQRHKIAGHTGTYANFGKLAASVDAGGEDVIPTPWGGVVITRHEPPQVEKYLVIRRGSYLALETHAEKVEHLEVEEGAGLILWRRGRGEALAVQPLSPGDSFDFQPGMEHCLIGTEDLLVFERSTDPKGMDQDLIFLYTPE